MGLSKGRLLAWLHVRATGQTPLVHAVYRGMADRIERGDFDVAWEEEGREQ